MHPVAHVARGGAVRYPMRVTTAPLAARPMRFVRVTTDDRVPLDGIVFEPDGVPAGGVLIVHGAGSHFYQRLHQRLGLALAGAGYRVLSGNNRGHDLGAYFPNDGQEVLLGGSAWERFADSPLDIAAWIDLIEREDQSAHAVPLALLGHSLGAAKVAYYQATTQDPRVGAVIGCSGLAIGSRMRARFRPSEEQVQRARDFVAARMGEHLLEASFQRRLISAQTFLDRYERFASGSAGDSLSKIGVPLLAIYATGEGGTPELLAEVQRQATGAPRCDTFLVPDADHDYHDHEAIVAGRIVEWLGTVLSPRR